MSFEGLIAFTEVSHQFCAQNINLNKNYFILELHKNACHYFYRNLVNLI